MAAEASHSTPLARIALPKGVRPTPHPYDKKTPIFGESLDFLYVPGKIQSLDTISYGLGA